MGDQSVIHYWRIVKVFPEEVILYMDLLKE